MSLSPYGAMLVSTISSYNRAVMLQLYAELVGVDVDVEVPKQ